MTNGSTTLMDTYWIDCVCRCIHHGTGVPLIPLGWGLAVCRLDIHLQMWDGPTCELPVSKKSF